MQAIQLWGGMDSMLNLKQLSGGMDPTRKTSFGWDGSNKKIEFI